jgi:nucleotide-binding universal stress UspA family protein
VPKVPWTRNEGAMQENGSIVAGYDGSAEAVAAVHWAAHQADLRGCPLHVVHCSIWPLLTRNLGPVPGIVLGPNL